MSGKANELFVARTEYIYRQRAIVIDNNKWIDKPSLEKALYDVKSVLNGENKKWGVMIAGNVGTGKTTLLKAIQSFFVVMSHVGFIPNGIGLRLQTSKNIAEMVIKSSVMHYAYFNEPLLAIDDLGNDASEISNYGRNLTPIVDLLEYRYSRKLVTFVSTNLSAKERAEKYGNRVADRFNEMFLKIVFNENSYR